MRITLSNTAFFLFIGCATVERGAEPKKLSTSEAFAHQDVPEAAERLPTPEAFARSFRRSIECEEQARTFQQRAPDAAWSYLKACVARGRFTQLPQLLDFWATELKRPDAAQVLASVVAARGLLKADLTALQQQGLAYFDLASAIDRPATFRGRTVLFFGQIRGSYEDTKSSTVEIDELSLGSMPGEAVESLRTTTETTSRTRLEGQLQAPMLPSGQGQGTLQHDSASTRGRTSLRYETVIEKTGHDVIGRLSKNDPFLSSAHPWLFVAKFDDVWRPEKGDEVRVPVVSILSWHELSPPAWSASLPAGF